MSTPQVNEVGRPRTATEYAYRAVKHMVLSGELAPGERIDQDEIAERLELSKMPVRSALDKLAAEGLLIIHPHRGVSVSPLSASDLDDIYLVRCTLESLAVKLATAVATSENLAELRRMVEEQDQLSARPYLDAALQANRDFHMYIYRLAGRTVLLRLIEGLWDQSERYRRIFLNRPGMLGNSTSEHRHLVDLIASGDAEAAAAFLVEHNRKTQKTLLAHMIQTERETVADR